MKKELKDVAFLCQFFYPEYVSSATLPYDVAEALVQSGHTVGALVGYPKEYHSHEDVPKREQHNGIDIKRVKYIQLKRTGALGRIVNFLSFFVSILFNIRFLKKYKTVVVYSNPPIIPLIAIIAKKLYKTKIIFISFDVYPEIAINTSSASEKGIITRVFRMINKSLFKNVDRVVALSSDMREFLIENRNITPEKVITIPNWYMDSGYSEQKKDEKFTVSYLGNLGTCQDETTLMKAIEELKNDRTVEFVFAGHGNKMDELKKYISEHEIHNAKVYGFLHGEKYSDVLSKSDCFIVTLVDNMLGLCSPSKAISYMMSGKPVICIMDERAGLAKDVAENDAGRVFSVGDNAALCAFIRELRDDSNKCLAMGKNARSVYLKRYEKKVCMEQYIELVDGLDDLE